MKYGDMGGMPDKGEAKKKNERYMPKGMGGKVMGHDKKPAALKVPCGEALAKMQMKGMSKKGYPDKAFDYKH